MTKLEDIKVGSLIEGLTLARIKILNIKWRGENILEVVFEDEQENLGKQLLSREDENRLTVCKNQSSYHFDMSKEKIELILDAYRINLAYFFDPYLAIHNSQIDPLPHQISAVYQEMLPKVPLRYVLADDPGAGKTIMAGLLLKELIVREDLKKCLIVSPKSLIHQWQNELFNKFDLKFSILSKENFKDKLKKVFLGESIFLIASLDGLARNSDLQEDLKNIDWDLVIIDEAHKCSATAWGKEIHRTKRFNLAQTLSNHTKNFLLLTATPHNGKDQDFQLFMSLIDPDRFSETYHNYPKEIDLSQVMRRLVKEDLVYFDGKPLFPERKAYTINYKLSPLEKNLYHGVTEYVRHEFDRADKLKKEKRTTLGLALTILQKRLASSPEAIYQSLKRRRIHLQERLYKENWSIKEIEWLEKNTFKNQKDLDEDDYLSEELNNLEDLLQDYVSASQSKSELEKEIATLKKLENLAFELRLSGEDYKWKELSNLLQENDYMIKKDEEKEKLIIFTEYKDTLVYLKEKIISLFGTDEGIISIQGGMSAKERHEIEEKFKSDKRIHILLATDAASEGINLQQAHLMINYDLPWNPNRLEQRFGRIHRIGQKEVCHLWNLVAQDTQEGRVFNTLLSKLDEERKTLGGKVFDILGTISFENKSLKELLIEAIRYGNDPKVKNRLNEIVTKTLDTCNLQTIWEEQRLTKDVLPLSQVKKLSHKMNEGKFQKLDFHFIESFFLRAFQALKGDIKKDQEKYQILRFPPTLQTQFSLKDYKYIYFDKNNDLLQENSQLIYLGHPLLTALSHLIIEESQESLKEGVVLIDESDPGIDPKNVFYIETTIKDGTNQIISENFHFIEYKNNKIYKVAYNSSLDYRPMTLKEKNLINGYFYNPFHIQSDGEDKILNFVTSTIIPTDLELVKNRRLKEIKRIEKAVLPRLTSEIQYWDYQASELHNLERNNKSEKFSSKQAEKRADELEARLNNRKEELKKEKQIIAHLPVLKGKALILPKGLLDQLDRDQFLTSSFDNKKIIEKIAMDTVIEMEKKLGFCPKDVSSLKCGYDIESINFENPNQLRKIEVKGRKKGASTITISKNEILAGLNNPENFILALVEVEGTKTRTTYLSSPFEKELDRTAVSANFDINQLKKQSKILLEEDLFSLKQS